MKNTEDVSLSIIFKFSEDKYSQFYAIMLMENISLNMFKKNIYPQNTLV